MAAKEQIHNRKKPKSNFERVQEFHRIVCEHDYDGKQPRLLPIETLQLRIKLIDEEETELKESHEEGDIVNCAKELADLLYVVYGMADEMHIPIDKVFKEVHKNNMSKLGPDGKPIRRSDGKILKPDSWKPLDMKKLERIIKKGI